MKEYVKEILKAMGDDPDREGLVKTPLRVESSLKYLTRGYHMDVEKILNEALFTEDIDEMVIVKDIEIFSLCEHHLLPFYGRCHVAYLPKGKIVGLSKIPRLVEVYSRRLQVQERLTTQIANTLEGLLTPLGVAVVIEAKHLCMMMRGVEKFNTTVTTSCMLGVFKEDRVTRMEFMNLISSMKAV